MDYCTCYSACLTGVCTCDGSGFGGERPIITCCTGLPNYETGEIVDCLANSRCEGCTRAIEKFNDGIGIKDNFSYSKFVDERIKYNKRYVHDWFCYQCGKYLCTSSNLDTMIDPTHIKMFCEGCWGEMNEET